MSETKRVVIVDDDVIIAEHLADLCEENGTEVAGLAHNASEAEKLIFSECPDYVLMDLRLGDGRDGVDLALEAHRRLPDARIIFVTGSNEPTSIERINSDHPYRILIKPISPPDLTEALS